MLPRRSTCCIYIYIYVSRIVRQLVSYCRTFPRLFYFINLLHWLTWSLRGNNFCFYFVLYLSQCRYATTCFFIGYNCLFYCIAAINICVHEGSSHIPVLAYELLSRYKFSTLPPRQATTVEFYSFAFSRFPLRSHN